MTSPDIIAFIKHPLSGRPRKTSRKFCETDVDLLSLKKLLLFKYSTCKLVLNFFEQHRSDPASVVANVSKEATILGHLRGRRQPFLLLLNSYSSGVWHLDSTGVLRFLWVCLVE